MHHLVKSRARGLKNHFPKQLELTEWRKSEVSETIHHQGMDMTMINAELG